MEHILQKQAEICLGTAIGPHEWSKAKAYAENKLASIISRFGDGGGIRRESWYLAQLIAEAFEGQRFFQFTVDLERFVHENDGQSGDKKEQPAFENAGPSYNHPYCNTQFLKKQ